MRSPIQPATPSMRSMRVVASFCALGALLTSSSALLAQVPPAPAEPAPPPEESRSSEQWNQEPTTEPGSPRPADSGVSQEEPGLELFLKHADLKHGLTSEQVAARAVARSALVEQRQAAARGAKAQEDEAVARLWPDLNLSASYTRINNVDMPQLGGEGALVGTTQTDPGPIGAGEQLFAMPPFSFPILRNRFELRATLNIPVSDYVYRTGTAIRSAEHSSAAARRDEEAAKLRVAADARLAYYDWVRAIGQQIVAEQTEANMQARLKDAQVLHDSGLLSQADLLGTQAQAKNAEVLAVQARHFTRVTEERLRTITYDSDPKRVYKVGENLLEPLEPVTRAETTEELLEEAIRHRAELKTLRESEEAIKGLISLAKSEGHPRLDLRGNYVFANPNPYVFPQRNRFEPLWDVSVVLSWNPTGLVRANAVASQQQARMDELKAQRRALIESLRLEVTQASQAVSEADSTLEAAQEALVAAQESYRGRRELFRIGQGTLVDVNDAEVALTRARLALINAHIDARTSRVRLRYALGRDRLPQGQ